MNVLLISSSEGIALQVANLLDLRGDRCHVVSIWPSGQEARFSRRCHGYAAHVVRGFGPAERAEFLVAVATYCVTHQIDVIVPVGLWATFVVSTVYRYLPVAAYPVPEPACLYGLHNKWHLYGRLRALGVPTPSTSMVAAGTPLLDRGVRLPVVVKPLTNGGSTGVSICHTSAQLAAVAGPASHARLVQQFVPGLDGVFGAFAWHGQIVAWTLHTKSPTELSFFPDVRIEATMRAIVRDTGFTGACNFDLRLDVNTGAFSVIECNPRLWASVGASAWYGVDVVDVGLRHALGQSAVPGARTAVTDARRLPNPDLKPFMRGVLRGAHPLRVTAADLPWRMLTDPLPLLRQRLGGHHADGRRDDTGQVDAAMAAAHDWDPAMVAGQPV